MTTPRVDRHTGVTLSLPVPQDACASAGLHLHICLTRSGLMRVLRSQGSVIERKFERNGVAQLGRVGVAPRVPCIMVYVNLKSIIGAEILVLVSLAMIVPWLP